MDVENIRGYYDRGKIVVNLACYCENSLIGQFVHTAGKGGEIVRERLIILVSCEHPFIRVNKILVQHPRNNISIFVRC